MDRGSKRLLLAAAFIFIMAGCGSQSSDNVRGGILPQTAHAIPIQTPTPTPAPLLGGLLSPVIALATDLLPVCTVLDASQGECSAIRNLDVVGVLDGLLGVIPGYHPSDLQKAYRLPSSSAGYGQTVGIVVAYDDPNAESDMSVYRSRFGLPACTSSNGCFRKIAQSGASGLPSPDQNWSQETSVDLDMVSAVCPHCHIVLVEANSSAVDDLLSGIQTAIANGANVVSNSYSALETPSLVADDSQLNHPGVAIVAGAGDSGYGVGWPASSEYVTAVGGTTLNRSLLGGFSEKVWVGTGSGCSAYIAKPSWQTDGGCSKRTVADVAAVADPHTGVSVYDTYLSADKGWLEFGGTSVATPIIAGAYALAGNASSTNGASYIYAHRSGLTDVTSGNDGSCSDAYLCTAGRGYDGPSGLGVPNGVGAF